MKAVSWEKMSVGCLVEWMGVTLGIAKEHMLDSRLENKLVNTLDLPLELLLVHTLDNKLEYKWVGTLENRLECKWE